MFIEEISNDEEWRHFMQSSCKGTFYHTLKWKRILEKSFPFEPVYLVIKDSSGSVVGISPFFISKFWPFKILDSLPFSDFGGPLIKEEYVKEASDLIRGYLVQLAHDRGVTYTRMRFSDPRLCKYFKSASSKVTTTVGVMSLDLKEKPVDYIWNKVFTAKGGQRKYIKRFERDGFQMKEAENMTDLNKFYSLYSDNINYIGASPFPSDFFKNMWISLYPESFNILLVEKKEKCFGADAFFTYKDTLYTTYLGLDREASKKYHIAYYLFWETIKWAQKRGLRYVTFGSTPSNPNSVHYSQKKNVGADFIQHYFLYIPFNEKLFSLRENAIILWKRMRNRLPKSIISRFEGISKSKEIIG